MPKNFVEKWMHVTEHGGVGLVAVVANGGEHIVAEAGVALLPDGDGELALTVARKWRGWLGPFLLDALVQEAAARGIPNLQAEILVDNGAMFSLVRSRGYAILDHGDWSSVHVTIGTGGYPPGWPEHDDQPRVLVETPVADGPPRTRVRRAACRSSGVQDRHGRRVAARLSRAVRAPLRSMPT